MGFPDMAPDKWNLQFRIRRAIRLIIDYEAAGTLRTLIWKRLSRDPSESELPPLERLEYPADLFIDVVQAAKATGDPSVVVALQTACGILLEEQANSFVFENLSALSDLIYLAARIESAAALGPLLKLLQHGYVYRLIRPGETVRLRTVRALLGILISHPNLVTEQHREAFRSVLLDARCTHIALTSLIGIFHENRDDLLDMVEKNGIVITNDEIDFNLRAAGLDVS